MLDAEPVVQRVVTRILERQGHTVQATGSIAEAFQLLRTFVPDLLLTNVFLPGIRGHDAAIVLRQMRPGMRVLMVAGLPDDQQVFDMTRGDGIEPFPKPFTAEELVTKVNQVLER